MRRKLSLGLIVIPLGVLLVALAVVNRQAATLYLNPFGGGEAGPALEAPLFLFLLGAFAVGLIVGGCATWLSQGKWRRNARENRNEARALRRQADRLKKELEAGADRLPPPRARLAAD